MRTKKQMRQSAEEQLARIKANNLHDELTHEVYKLEEIIDETKSESTTDWIYDVYFGQLGVYGEIKRTITKAIKKQAKTKAKPQPALA